ncbi:MAG: agmatine deiminase [Acholeplasma sp.]|nr:agmatine deiminase [Acholeplasma sp.]
MNKKMYKMPFEGKKHDTIMILPYREDTWREGGKIAAKNFFEIINTIAKYEIVYVLKDQRVKYDITPILNNKNVKVLDIDYNDAWARDTSPIFMVDNNHGLIGLDFRFNAWGGNHDGLYSDYRLDDLVSRKVCEELKIENKYIEDFILEGGSIHTNGEGVILTTEACLLSKGRNPQLSQKEIEDILKRYLNAEKVLWLPRGIYNDETNEHVDNVACFADENTVLLAWTDDTSDPQYKLSKQSYDYLVKNSDYKIIKVPIPTPMYLSKAEEEGLISNNDSIKERNENDRLAGSYINFYMGDKYIILPKFNVKEDEIVLKQFKDIFKDKTIHQIDSKEILLGGGNIHCITMQIPRRD